MNRTAVSTSATGTSAREIKESVIELPISHNVKPLRPHLSRRRTTRARQLSGLIAIGLIMSVPNWALCQQGLHIVSSPFINNSNFYGPVAITDKDIWAVGYIYSGSTVTLAEHFNGTSWSVVPTPTVKGGIFFAVDGAASNDVWAVGNQASGNSSTALIEHWNGASWSVISGPNVGRGASLNAIVAISSNDVWAAGSNSSSGVLVEHWNGVSWSVVSSAAFSGLGPVLGISADSSNDVWAVGDGMSLHWNGLIWSQVPPPSNFRGNGVTTLSPTNVWAAGSRHGEHPDSLAKVLHWDGVSWSFSTTVNPLAANNLSSTFTGIAAVSANNIWVVGTFVEQWNGSSWNLVNSPSGVRLLGVTALTDGTVIAVGQQCNSSSSCSAAILEN
jgi:hypothetical protein